MSGEAAVATAVAITVGTEEEGDAVPKLMVSTLVSHVPSQITDNDLVDMLKIIVRGNIAQNPLKKDYLKEGVSYRIYNLDTIPMSIGPAVVAYLEHGRLFIPRHYNFTERQCILYSSQPEKNLFVRKKEKEQIILEMKM